MWTFFWLFHKIKSRPRLVERKSWPDVWEGGKASGGGRWGVCPCLWLWCLTCLRNGRFGGHSLLLQKGISTTRVCLSLLVHRFVQVLQNLWAFHLFGPVVWFVESIFFSPGIKHWLFTVAIQRPGLNSLDSCWCFWLKATTFWWLGPLGVSLWVIGVSCNLSRTTHRPVTPEENGLPATSSSGINADERMEIIINSFLR